MCGIAGIISPSGVTQQRVKSMMDRMKHRGPDGEDIWCSNNKGVCLGHVRLAIVDKSDAGKQPMHHVDGLHSVANGEIYNYPQLRSQMEGEVNFLSNCDSEIVLHGHANQGVDFLKKLNGMFAFALYDEPKKQLILARDRLGIKPLYYTVYNGALIFASEIKAIFGGIDATEWEIDKQGLSEFLTYQTPINQRTLFENVRQVQPGHFIKVDINHPENFEELQFWEAKIEPNSELNFPDSVDRFDQVFAASIERHLLSDVDVSSYLSAGFDSSSVFAQAAISAKNDPQHSFTGFTGKFDKGNDWYNETKPAKELASQLGVEHQVVNISVSDVVEHFDSVIDALDEPRMGMGAFSQYMVAKKVSDRFKVVLTGHGGDELFSGYPVYAFANRGLMGIRELSELPHFVYFFLAKLQSFFQPERAYFLPVLWPCRQQYRLFSKALMFTEPWRELEKNRKMAKSSHDKVLFDYLKAYLPGLLIVEDKISMAHSVEARTPILDNEVVELSLKVPASVKLNSGVLKAIIKERAMSKLPPTFFNQPKRGFPTPFRHWLRSELNQFMLDRLTGRSSYLRTIFQADEIEKFVNRYQVSWRKNIRPLDEIQSHQVWQLLSLESWLRVWFEKYGVKLKLT